MNVPVIFTPVDTTNLSSDTVTLPAYARPGDAGCDVRANLPEPVVLYPGQRQLLPTGIRVAIPEGYEIQIRPRSGLAHKHGVTVLNTPGTIDSGYRDEVGVILINHGTAPLCIQPGDRIAQMVLARFETIEWEPVAELPESERKGGLGHTGVN